MSGKVYLEFSAGTSNKFWEGEVDGVDLTTRWGKQGSDGQAKTKRFDTEAEALAALQKAVKSKTGKGYVEASTGGSDEAPADAASADAASTGEAVAPAPAPTPAPAPEALPAPTSTSDTIAWTDETLSLVAPMRGRVHVALPPVSEEIDELVSRLRPAEGMSRVIEDILGAEELGGHMRAALEWSEGDREAMTEAQAMAAMVLEGDQMLQLVIRYAAREFGAARACELFVDSLGYAYVTQNDYSSMKTTYHVAAADEIESNGVEGTSNLPFTQSFKLRGVVTVRRLMSALSEAEYAALVERATPSWAALPKAHQVTLAALFPERTAWAEEGFEYVTTGYYEQSCTGLILLTPQPDENVIKLLNGGFHGRVFEENCYTLLYSRGPAALELMAKSPNVSHMLSAAAIVRGPGAARFWCVAVEANHESFGQALEAMSTFPVLALVGLSHVDTAIARALSASVASANPGALERAVAMEESNAARLERMLPARPDELAPAGALPAFLADPPWSREKKKASRPVKFEGLSAPALETRLLFTGEDVARIAEPYERQLGRDDEANEEQDAARRAAIMKRVVQEGTYSPYVAQCTGQLMTMNSLESVREAWGEVPRSFWKVEVGQETCMEFALSRFGEEVLDVVLELGRRRVQTGVAALQRVESVEVARLMAEGFARVKSARVMARDWIDERPVYAMLSIVPDAFGGDRELRVYAEKTLTHIGKTNAREALLAAARGHYEGEVVDALDALLGRDPLEVLPKRMPKVPAWLSPKVLPELVFEEDPSWRLSDQSVEDVLQMLTFYDPEDPYPGFEQLRETFTRRSLDGFALAVCETWLGLDGSSKQSWALQSVGELGGDESVRALTPKIRKWPGESAVKRAQWGLDVLARIGTDLALMNVYSISQKIKFKSLKAHASALVDQIADERGLTRVELGDRLVPDFDLDARGRLTLDFGPRQFEVRLDETLKPILRDGSGKTLKSLPRPNAKDDEEKAKEAKATLSGLKKDLKAVAKQQLQRLEDALVQQRRWGAGDFVAFLVDHPLMINLTHRLLWGAWEDDELAQTFRVDIDQSFLDVEDEEVDVTGHQIGLLHPSQVEPAVSLAWQQVISDYEVIQPFDQLDRPFHERADALETIERRIIGAKVGAPKLVFGLEKHGWERGPAEDGGAFYYHTRPLADVEQLIISYEGVVGMGYIEEGEQLTIEEVYVAKEYAWRREAIEVEAALGALGDITLSEVTQELLRVLS